MSLPFLHRLLRPRGGRKVFLSVDRHPAHKARGVTRWLAARADQIARFLLPGHSPEPNPDELLNHDVKTNALGRRHPGDPAEMMGDAWTYLRSRTKQPGLVRRTSHEGHVRYAAARRV